MDAKYARDVKKVNEGRRGLVGDLHGLHMAACMSAHAWIAWRARC